jgi:hypothetical protein
MSKMLKLSMEEKDFLDKVVAFSGIEKTQVKEVFKALLRVTSLLLHGDNNEIYIPFICKLLIDHTDVLTDKGIKTHVKLTALPSECLRGEVTAICEGDILPTERYLKKQIIEKFQQITGVEGK